MLKWRKNRGGYVRLKRFIGDMDKPLLFATVFLFIFGLLNIVTASSSEAVTSAVPLYFYFYRHLMMLVAGLIATIIILNTKTKKYKPFAVIAYVVIIMILIYLSMYGSDHRGSRNWVSIAGFQFQPSEFAKPILIVCVALLFEKFYYKLRSKKYPHWDMIAKIVIIGGMIPFIVFTQKDLGTMFILFSIFGVMFWASPVIPKEKIKTIGVVFVVIVFALVTKMAVSGHILSGAQKSRFDFINPCSKYETGGYQICNGFIAINDGGLVGLGAGKSKQKYSYIPEPHTDSVFAIIAEEEGFLKCSIVFLLYIVVLYRILNLASKANTIRGRYICIGVAIYIFMHIFLNLGGLFGVIPLTGVPLPFLSYGGSFTIALMASLAMVQRISVETKREKIKIPTLVK